jgi:bifunctional NMN adenylyltransferase/nudix hydrolase
MKLSKNTANMVAGTPTNPSKIASNKYDFLVFIGRFQPVHNGHLEVIRQALVHSKKLIILIGSAHSPRNLRNPWTVLEREAMIRANFSALDNENIITAPLMDVLYNDKVWVRNVQNTVNGLVTAHNDQPHKQPNIALIGHNKDASSYYLNLFPQWSSMSVKNINGLSATPIRENLFSSTNAEAANKSLDSAELKGEINATIKATLQTFVKHPAFEQIADEQAFIHKYTQQWQTAPYAPTFVTVDAVVVQSGHILLVQRKAKPGQGLWALPGGFINAEERLIDGCLRELKEETKLKVPLPVLKGSVIQSNVYDEPTRSTRGRTITHAFHIELNADKTLAKVKGSDDAEKAFWLPLSELSCANMFEDHYFIIQDILGL